MRHYHVKFFFLFILFQWSLTSFGQCTPCDDPAPVGIVDYNSARISILSGGNLEFSFQNISDYENGVTLLNKTVIGISICDCSSEVGTDPIANSSITGWDLYFDTDDNQLTGSNPANTLPLCFLEAEATIRSGLAGVNVTGRQALEQEGSPATPIATESTDPLTISDRFWSSDQLNISYYLAVPPTNAICTGSGNTFPLINQGNIVGDFYTATISFTLVPRCTACIDVSY